MTTPLSIPHWSHSSLTTYLRNPIAFKKRYIDLVRDMPSSPASIIGRACHKALEHFYDPTPSPTIKYYDHSMQVGFNYLRNVMDTEINFGVAKTKKAKREKRKEMEAQYLQAISFYLENAPKYDVLAVEFSNVAQIDDLLPLPVKAISDLVVASGKNAVDIVDHKFVKSFSDAKADKTLFVIQALFNYYTVTTGFDKPVKRFIIHECKITKNKDGSPQMRRYVIRFDKCQAEFELFHRLLRDATRDLARREVFLPNPSDMYEGEQSTLIYKLGL
jgi:S-DNA-T family DNA segregation ATPase FtsK/SpoIIIE